jgi:hypothetical protein
MTAEIRRLVTKPQRLQAQRARELLDTLSGSETVQLEDWERVLLTRAVTRIAEPPGTEAVWKGGFIMISREVCGLVWDWIRNLPKEERPQEVRHAFDLVVLNVAQDTGEVRLSREQLAKAMGVHPDKAGRAMRVLERHRILISERMRVAGMQGPGIVTWRINPNIAWNGNLAVRKEEAAATPPLLCLMEGGKSVVATRNDE